MKYKNKTTRRVLKRFSFDVFDTCLMRVFGEPHILFDLLAHEILGGEASISELIDFAKIRKEAEINARLKNEGLNEDVSLEDIYKECNFSSLTNVQNEVIKKTELLLEAKYLKPIQKTKELIQKIHSRGYNVIFITDMYLPSSFILGILREKGFYIEGDELYVSNEVGLTKSTGNLFTFVRRQQPCFLWNHLGDNIHSDCIKPLFHGILGRKVEFPYSYYERQLFQLNKYPNMSPVFISASISRYIRNVIGGNLAADIMAPIYVTFTYGVLKDARNKGINKLYFAARDSYPFYIIAQKLSPFIYPEIKLVYLYISRKSTYFATIEDLSRERLLKLYNQLTSRKLESFLDILGINESIFDNNKIRSLKQLSGYSLIDAMLENSTFVEVLNSKKKESEESCLSYLIQEGLGVNNCAILDLRGSRSSIVGVNNLLLRHGHKTAFSYYFEVLDRRILENKNSPYLSLLYADRLETNLKNIPLASNILEEYFSASNQQRTSGYIFFNDKWVPEFEENVSDDIELRKKIGEINIKSCEMYSDFFISFHLEKYYKDILFSGLQILNEFMRYPHKNYLRELIGFRISDSSVESCPLIYRWLYKRNQTGWTRGSLFYLLYSLFNPFYSK